MKLTIACSLCMGFYLMALPIFAQPGKQEQAVMNMFQDTSVIMPDVYEFDTAVKMQLISEPNDVEPSEMVYTMRYNPSASYVCLFPETINKVAPPAESVVLVDFETNMMTTFMPASEQLMAMTYKIPNKKRSGEEFENLRGTEFEATGEEKVIAGYTCQAYRFTSSDMTGEIWITPDLNINFDKSFQALGLKFEIGDKGLKTPKGFIMKFNTTQTESKSKSRMEVLAVDLASPYTLTTTGYTFTSMPVITEEQE